MSALWLVTNRPWELLLANVVRDCLRGELDAFHLLMEDSRRLGRADWRPHAAPFDTVTVLPKAEAPRGLAGVFRAAGELRRVRDAVAGLALDRHDWLFSFLYLSPLVNALLSVHPEVFRTLCLSRKKYGDFMADPEPGAYRHSTASRLNRSLLEPALGLLRTYHLRHRRPHGADGEWLRGYDRPLHALFPTVLVLDQDGTPEDLPAGTLTAPLPRVASPVREAGTPGEVVFCGSPFLSHQNLPAAEYAGQLDRCLDYLRRHYGGRRLVYRPHPFERDEPTRLDLSGFQLSTDSGDTELYLQRHADTVEALYSVSSTVSRTAMALGFNAYAFYPVFPFAPRTREFFAGVMGAVPDGFLVTDLDRPPVRYQPESPPSAPDPFRQAVARLRQAYRASLSGAGGAP